MSPDTTHPNTPPSGHRISHYVTLRCDPGLSGGRVPSSAYTALTVRLRPSLNGLADELKLVHPSPGGLVDLGNFPELCEALSTSAAETAGGC